MTLQSMKPSTSAWKTGLCAALFLLLNTQTHAQSGPFAGLSGAWSGGGTITMSNGARERIRCRANYSVGRSGNDLQQQLRCASDSYQFILSSSVSYQGGAVTGTWSEATRNAGGNISGTASGGRILVRTDGPGFAANLQLVTQGDRQSVSIRSTGADITSASIALNRASR